LLRLLSPPRATHAHIRASHFTAPAVGPPNRPRATERTCQIGRAATLTVLFVLVALIAVIPRTRTWCRAETVSPVEYRSGVQRQVGASRRGYDPWSWVCLLPTCSQNRTSRKADSSRQISGCPVTCRFPVGVAGFEPAASSSRRQRDRCMASANTAWTRWLPSAEVRQCPSKSGVIVAQFVTQADDHVQRAVRFSGGLASPRRSITDRLTGLYAVLATQGVRVHLLVPGPLLARR
jgi:hypothetical protein